MATSKAGGAPGTITVDGNVIKLSNLDKVLYPKTGFTKAQIIDYYLNIAPALLPHLRDRPLTLHRFPNGVDTPGFYEKTAPAHRPDFVASADVKTTHKVLHQVLAQDRSTLVWLANIASLEMHPLLSKYTDNDTPTKLTFDLDPGAPATIVECSQVALHLRALFDEFDMQTFPKSSGSKGMQVEVPLNTPVTFAQSKPFAHAVAQLLEARHSDLVVSDMSKELRKTKVLVDWSQNDHVKTTIAAYSLRARDQPWVSTPLTWDEVEQAAATPKGSDVLRFETHDVLERVQRLGDLAAPVETLQQSLPNLTL